MVRSTPALDAVDDPALASLPRGRHSLTREQVSDAQRLRLAVAMAEAMAEDGYVGTPVAAILRGAGVSRQTFYELYDDKLACFLDALDLVSAVLVGELAGVVAGGDSASGSPIERAERAAERYLDTLVRHPAFARLYVVEVHAAGPEALRRRADLQARIVDALADLLGAQSAEARFACQAFVAAISSLVTLPLVLGDVEEIAALRGPLIAHLRALVDGGLLDR